MFYTNALASKEIRSGLDSLGITKEILKAGLEQVEELAQAILRKEGPKGDARHATQKRNEAVAELKKWTSKFRRICFVALNGSQKLESPG